MALQRQAVVRVALVLLDEVGLEGLTVRRLAGRLGVQNPALYWHFKNKQKLLDAMANTMFADAFAGIQPPVSHDMWEDWLADVAQRFRRALLTHRDGARVIATADLSGSDLLDIQEMAMGVLTSAGFDRRTALVSVVAIFDYTLGAAFEEQADPDHPTWGRSTVVGPRRPSLDPSRAPLLAAASDELTTAASDDPNVGFKEGIHLILTGMAAKRDARRHTSR